MPTVPACLKALKLVRTLDAAFERLTGFVTCALRLGGAGSLAWSMLERSDAVVVGGGIVGAAALYYLVVRGCERPLLLECDTLGSGSTGHCAGVRSIREPVCRPWSSDG